MGRPPRHRGPWGVAAGLPGDEGPATPAEDQCGGEIRTAYIRRVDLEMRTRTVRWGRVCDCGAAWPARKIVTADGLLETGYFRPSDYPTLTPDLDSLPLAERKRLNPERYLPRRRILRLTPEERAVQEEADREQARRWLLEQVDHQLRAAFELGRGAKWDAEPPKVADVGWALDAIEAVGRRTRPPKE